MPLELHCVEVCSYIVLGSATVVRIIAIDRCMVDDLDFGGLVYSHKGIRIVQGPTSMF